MFFGAGVRISMGLPIRGLSGDLWADTVIGQRDFSEINPNAIVPIKFSMPVALSWTHQLLFPARHMCGTQTIIGF
jgi:hypothetical protein